MRSTFRIAFGMKINTREITLDKIKKPVLSALFGQLIINPIVMVCLIAMFSLSAEVRLGALMISVSPGGNGSNILTWIARGTLEISVVCTLTSTCLALATYPLFLLLGIKILGLESVQPDFKSLVISIVTTVVPLLIGVAINRFFGDRCGAGENGERRIDKISSVMILGAVIGFIVINGSYLMSPYDRAFIASAASNSWLCGGAQNICGLLIGYLVSRIQQLPNVYHRTLAFEVGAQNTLIAMTTATLAFSKEVRGVVISYILAYAITAFFINFGTAMFFRLATADPNADAEDDVGQDGDKGSELTTDGAQKRIV